MQWHVITYPVVSWALIAGVLAWWNGWGLGMTAAFAALFIILHLVWARYRHNNQTRQLLRGLQPSDKRLTLQPDAMSLALAQNGLVLWLLEISSLAFVAAGLFVLAVDPGKWLVALASIGFFGLCAAGAAYMLFLRWGATTRP
jgi:hypothetical protein